MPWLIIATLPSMISRNTARFLKVTLKQKETKTVSGLSFLVSLVSYLVFARLLAVAATPVSWTGGVFLFTLLVQELPCEDDAFRPGAGGDAVGSAGREQQCGAESGTNLCRHIAFRTVCLLVSFSHHFLEHSRGIFPPVCKLVVLTYS